MAERRLLPNRRASWSQKASVGGHTIYVGFGEYEDGTLGEIWLDVSKAGSALRATMHALAITVSIGIQSSVPFTTYADAFKDMDFLPSGMIQGVEGMEDVQVTSILDLVAKLVERFYGNNSSQPETAVVPPLPATSQ